MGRLREKDTPNTNNIPKQHDLRVLSILRHGGEEPWYPGLACLGRGKGWMDIPLRKGERKQVKLVKFWETERGRRDTLREREQVSPVSAQANKNRSSGGLIPWKRAARRREEGEGKDRVSLASSHQSGIEECILMLVCR